MEIYSGLTSSFGQNLYTGGSSGGGSSGDSGDVIENDSQVFDDVEDFDYWDSFYKYKTKAIPQQNTGFFIGENIKILAAIGKVKDGLFISKSDVVSITANFYKATQQAASNISINPIEGWTGVDVDPDDCILEQDSGTDWPYNPSFYNFEYVPYQGASRIISTAGTYYYIIKIELTNNRLPCFMISKFIVF